MMSDIERREFVTLLAGAGRNNSIGIPEEASVYRRKN
jgi:hypothetical protein